MIDANIKGRLFETWVFHKMSVIASVLGGELFYLRKQGGMEREIDFIFEIDGEIYPIEVKASEKVTLKDAENMELLRVLKFTNIPFIMSPNFIKRRHDYDRVFLFCPIYQITPRA